MVNQQNIKIMYKQILSHICILFLLFSLYTCQSKPVETITFLSVPAGLNSSEPNLHSSDDGNIYLSWIEHDKDTVSHLKFSILSNNKWSTPKTIAKGKGWFVNWADFPSITSFGASNLSAHFLEKSADDTYAYDVKLIQSTDHGETWNDAFKPHSDNTKTEHGFVSKVAINDSSYLSVWLDGRQNAYAETDSTITAQMTLRSAIINDKGEIIEEHLLDNRVCDCCQTDVAMTAEGPIVVYRNRSEEELRDTYYVKQVNGSWTEPKPIFTDNWKIAGCPVNGPSISAKGNNVAVTWFTVADNTPKVKVAFSSDNGNTFESPLTLAEETIMGRLDIELLDDGSAIISCMDSKDGESIIVLQHVKQDGTLSAPFLVSQTANSRSSGFPRMIIKDDAVYLAWTSVGDNLNVQTAKILIDAIKQ
jgi:hypothetical protein